MNSFKNCEFMFHPKNSVDLHVLNRKSSYFNKLDLLTAHKKGSGSTKNGRDSVSKRRGVKVYGDQRVHQGGVIIRQVGTAVYAGENVKYGKDYTIFALTAG